MLPYSSDDFDTRTTTWLVKHWGKNSTCDAIIAVISEWTPVTMIAVIAAAVFGFSLGAVAGRIATQAGFTAVVAAVAARVINEPVGALFHRSRPFQSLGYIPLVHHDASASFPSNHATGAFALAVAMCVVPGYGPLLMGLAGALAIGRIYVGLHYVSDVVVGAIHGAVMAWVVSVLFQSLHIYSLIGAW